MAEADGKRDGLLRGVWFKPNLDLWLDLGDMGLGQEELRALQPKLEDAISAMEALEAGAIANPDENRMVGHYWLRNPDLAPTSEIRKQILDTKKAIFEFAGQVHFGSLRGGTGKPFRNLLIMGIGGSILGPQLLATALTGPEDKMRAWYFDNTDPDGFHRILRRLHNDLDRTLCLVVSKSGKTIETLNAMAETAEAMRRVGLSFRKQAVAVTQPGSELEARAEAEQWLAVFPIWEWVGGRTSLFSPVGLLPAALLGLDIEALLQGAARMDAVTRTKAVADNPAALLAAAWYHASVERGLGEMVVEPYKDRLSVWSRYLQQLVMESVGKEKTLDGRTVNAGLTVYGNKGSTDQHSILQHLYEGPSRFFVEFVHVMRDLYGTTWASGAAFEVAVQVERDVVSGDCLLALMLGARQALAEKGRPSYTIFLDRLDALSLGELVALHERAVGYYASLLGINAYNQPGVVRTKELAFHYLDIQRKVLAVLKERQPAALTAAEVAEAAGLVDETKAIYLLLRHMAQGTTRGIRRVKAAAPDKDTFFWERGEDRRPEARKRPG